LRALDEKHAGRARR